MPYDECNFVSAFYYSPLAAAASGNHAPNPLPPHLFRPQSGVAQ